MTEAIWLACFVLGGATGAAHGWALWRVTTGMIRRAGQADAIRVVPLAGLQAAPVVAVAAGWLAGGVGGGLAVVAGLFAARLGAVHFVWSRRP